MARKPKKKKEEDVESYRHEAETRKNAVPEGLASYDTAKPKPKKYDYDAYLYPQLIWSGKKEQIVLKNKFELPTSARSIPFAVKVIDHRGNEVMA